MNDCDARLALARQAWRATTPDPAEVAAGVRRVRVALARHANRTSVRRAVSVAVAALLVGAALAYAATGGRAWLDTESSNDSGALDQTPDSAAAWSSPNRPRPSAGPEQTTTAAPLEPVHEPSGQRGRSEGSSGTNPSETAAADSKSSLAARRLQATAPAAGPSRSGVERAAWAEVDRALAEHDERQAEGVLESLAASADESTRAKAKLGLAQLAVGRGDCERAQELAGAIVATPGVEATLIQRARRLARECR